MIESVCEDNRDRGEETQRPSGGMKMNKLMPLRVNSVVLLAVITISGLVTNVAIKAADTGGNELTLTRIIDPPDLT